jgi:hypothetical protein
VKNEGMAEVSDICGRIVNEYKIEAMYEYAGMWW